MRAARGQKTELCCGYSRWSGRHPTRPLPAGSEGWAGSGGRYWQTPSGSPCGSIELTACLQVRRGLQFGGVLALHARVGRRDEAAARGGLIFFRRLGKSLGVVGVRLRAPATLVQISRRGAATIGEVRSRTTAASPLSTSMAGAIALSTSGSRPSKKGTRGTQAELRYLRLECEAVVGHRHVHRSGIQFVIPASPALLWYKAPSSKLLIPFTPRFTIVFYCPNSEGTPLCQVRTSDAYARSATAVSFDRDGSQLTPMESTGEGLGGRWCPRLPCFRG